MKFFAHVKEKAKLSTSWKLHDIKSAVYKGVTFKLSKGMRYESQELSEDQVEKLQHDSNVQLEAVQKLPDKSSL